MNELRDVTYRGASGPQTARGQWVGLDRHPTRTFVTIDNQMLHLPKDDILRDAPARCEACAEADRAMEKEP